MSKNKKKKNKISYQRIFAIFALILMIGSFVASLMIYM